MSMSAPRWLRWAKYRLLLPLLARLPLYIGYRLASYLGRRYFMRYDAAWVQAYRQGLAQRYAQPSLVDHYLRLHLSLMAKEELDVYHLARMNAQNYTRWVRFDLQALHADPGPKCLLIGHYNRTILLSALGLAGQPAGVLTTDIQHNPNLDAFQKAYLAQKMQHAMTNMQGSWLTTDQNPRAILRALRANEALVIAIDTPGPESIAFMGGRLQLAAGIHRLGDKAGASYYYLRLLPRPASRYAIDVTAIKLQPDQGGPLQAAVDLLQQDIAAHPWLWWQWNALNCLWKKTDD